MEEKVDEDMKQHKSNVQNIYFNRIITLSALYQTDINKIICSEINQLMLELQTESNY